MVKKNQVTTTKIGDYELQYVCKKYNELPFRYIELDSSHLKLWSSQPLFSLERDQLYELHNAIDDPDCGDEEIAYQTIFPRVLFYHTLLKCEQLPLETKIVIAHLMHSYLLNYNFKYGYSDLMMVMAKTILVGGQQYHLSQEPYIKCLIRDAAKACNRAFISYFSEKEMKSEVLKLVPKAETLDSKDYANISFEDELKRAGEVSVDITDDAYRAEFLEHVEGILRYSENKTVKLHMLSLLLPYLSDRYLNGGWAVGIFTAYIIAATDECDIVKNYARTALVRVANEDNHVAERLAAVFFSFASQHPDRILGFAELCED